MAGSLPDTRRIRVVTARRGENGKQESLENKDGERECHAGITGLHRTSDSGPGEEVPHLGSGAAHRRATSITGTSGTAAVGRTSFGSCA